MKVEKLVKEKKFEKLEFKLTIETRDELISAIDALEEASDGDENGLDDLFQLLESQLKQFDK